MSRKLVFVLDIGTSKTVALSACLDESGNVQILAISNVPSRGIAKGMIVDLDLAAGTVREALTEIGYPGPTADLVVAVNGSHLEGVNAQGFVPISPANRNILPEDVLAVINHSRQVSPSPDREQIMAIPREFRVDDQKGITRPLGLHGSRLEVVTHIITGKIATMQNLERTIEMAGGKVSMIMPAPMASATAILNETAKEIGTAVIDLGASTTGVTVFAKGAVVRICCLPVGGAHVTNDIMTLLKMTPQDAEKLKKDHGRAHTLGTKEESSVDVRQVGQSQPRTMARKVLYEIIESRLKEIATLVDQELLASGYRKMLPGGILLTGGASQLRGSAQLFAKVLGDSQIKAASPYEQGPAGTHANSAEYSCAVGLAKHFLSGREDDLQPASGYQNWKEKILTLFQLKS